MGDELVPEIVEPSELRCESDPAPVMRRGVTLAAEYHSATKNPALAIVTRWGLTQACASAQS